MTDIPDLATVADAAPGTPVVLDPAIVVDPAVAPAVLMSAVRTAIVAAGAWASARGYVDGSAVTMIAGLVPAIVAAAWGIAVRYLAKRQLVQIAEDPKNVNVAVKGAA